MCLPKSVEILATKQDRIQVGGVGQYPGRYVKNKPFKKIIYKPNVLWLLDQSVCLRDYYLLLPYVNKIFKTRSTMNLKT
jgi:hypothetical protein